MSAATTFLLARLPPFPTRLLTLSSSQKKYSCLSGPLAPTTQEYRARSLLPALSSNNKSMTEATPPLSLLAHTSSSLLYLLCSFVLSPLQDNPFRQVYLDYSPKDLRAVRGCFANGVVWWFFFLFFLSSFFRLQGHHKGTPTTDSSSLP
jgi:hypothetical protein